MIKQCTIVKYNNILSNQYMKAKRFRNFKVKSIFQYIILIIRQYAGCKNFKVLSSNICTKDNVICIDEEYKYKEGRFLERAIIKEIKFQNFFIHLKVYFCDLDETTLCSHSLKPYGYSGMWRIMDKDYEERKRRKAKV